MYDIDLKVLYEAINHYKNLGYKMIPAPLLVDEDIVSLTLPEGRKAKEHVDGLFYVGSAEQSAYQLYKDGSLGLGKYMLLTPCQRYEDVLDETHLEIFLKLELISLGGEYSSILNDVLSFYNNDKCVVVNTSQGEDININDIEVGSFGSRIFMGKNFCFGTGIALPRYTQAINRSAS